MCCAFVLLVTVVLESFVLVSVVLIDLVLWLRIYRAHGVVVLGLSELVLYLHWYMH